VGQKKWVEVSLSFYKLGIWTKMSM